MDGTQPRTEFVRRTITGREYRPDEAYARDLLALERLASERPLGFASSLALTNLLSRYPREADAIVRELGMRPFVPLEEERVRDLTSERLRLAERRLPLSRRPRDDALELFEF